MAEDKAEYLATLAWADRAADYDELYEMMLKIILKSQVPDWLRDFRKAMEE